MCFCKEFEDNKTNKNILSVHVYNESLVKSKKITPDKKKRI